MPAHFWSDSVRTLVIAGWALAVGQTVAVIVAYLRAHRAVLKRGGSVPGLIPIHVGLVAVSFLLFSSEAAYFIFRRIGTSLSFWGLYNLGGFVIANAALWIIMKFERRREVEYDGKVAYQLPGETIIVDKKGQSLYEDESEDGRHDWPE